MSRASWQHVCSLLVSWLVLAQAEAHYIDPQVVLTKELQSGRQDKASPVHSASKSIRLPIEQTDQVFGLTFFFTNIALGSPAQPVTLLLDLGYGGIAVRSADCDSFCGRSWPNYNSSMSSTAVDLHRDFLLHLDSQFAYGKVYQDDVELLSITLHNFSIGAVNDFHGENIVLVALSNGIDGGLGLSPPNTISESYPPSRSGQESYLHPNLWCQLFTSHALEHNVMTLRLPINNSDRGQLILGEAAPEMDLVVPFSQKTSPAVLKDEWKVDLDSMTFAEYNGSNAHQIDLDLPAIVSLSPATALVLPASAVDAVLDHLGLGEAYDSDGTEIDCAKRTGLPDLELTIAGKKIRLTWEEYSVQWYGFGSFFCLVAIRKSWHDDTHAVIGLPLFRKFDMVFDVDRDEFGLVRKRAGSS